MIPTSPPAINDTDPSPCPSSVHFLGVCGKAMGGIAVALAQQGWQVSGSDEKCYSPMLEYLRDGGITIRTPYAAGNVPMGVGMVVVGKRVASTNLELEHVLANKIPHCSFPQFLHRVFLCRSRNAVVAGGVGKTTTTSMLAWILEYAGYKPDYLIGGQTGNFSASARFAGSRHAVLEGDEYASCFDDARPKFLHYQPEVGIITNIIEDHPDIYHTFEDLCGVFAAFVNSIPVHGSLITSARDIHAVRLARQAGCRLITTGFEEDATARIGNPRFDTGGSSFELLGAEFILPLFGHMNVMNAAMAVLAAGEFGIQPRQAAEALRLFAGVQNRQEEREFARTTLVSDKASHPRSLAELSRALRQRYPGRRLVSIIQPRATGGKDWVYQRDLPDALSGFDKVILTSAYEHNPQQPPRWADDPFCLDLLARALEDKSIHTTVSRTAEEIDGVLDDMIQDGDVVLLTILEQSHALRDRVVAALARGQCPTARRESTTG